MICSPTGMPAAASPGSIRTWGFGSKRAKERLIAELFGCDDAIRAEVKSRPDAIFAELCRSLGAVHGVSASDGLMHATLVKLGLTHKTRWVLCAPSWYCRITSSIQGTNRLRKFGSKACVNRADYLNRIEEGRSGKYSGTLRANGAAFLLNVSSLFVFCKLFDALRPASRRSPDRNVNGGTAATTFFVKTLQSRRNRPSASPHGTGLEYSLLIVGLGLATAVVQRSPRVVRIRRAASS